MNESEKCITAKECELITKLLRSSSTTHLKIDLQQVMETWTHYMSIILLKKLLKSIAGEVSWCANS